jgi:adenylate kinase family enzyme
MNPNSSYTEELISKKIKSNEKEVIQEIISKIDEDEDDSIMVKNMLISTTKIHMSPKVSASSKSKSKTPSPSLSKTVSASLHTPSKASSSIMIEPSTSKETAYISSIPDITHKILLDDDVIPKAKKKYYYVYVDDKSFEDILVSKIKIPKDKLSATQAFFVETITKSIIEDYEKLPPQKHKQQECIIMVGHPNSGKSMFGKAIVNNYLREKLHISSHSDYNTFAILDPDMIYSKMKEDDKISPFLKKMKIDKKTTETKDGRTVRKVNKTLFESEFIKQIKMKVTDNLLDYILEHKISFIYETLWDNMEWYIKVYEKIAKHYGKNDTICIIQLKNANLDETVKSLEQRNSLSGRFVSKEVLEASWYKITEYMETNAIYNALNYIDLEFNKQPTIIANIIVSKNELIIDRELYGETYNNFFSVNDKNVNIVDTRFRLVDDAGDHYVSIYDDLMIDKTYLRNGDIVYPIHRFLENSTTMEYPHPDETEKVFLAGYSITSLNKYNRNECFVEYWMTKTEEQYLTFPTISLTREKGFTEQIYQYIQTHMDKNITISSLEYAGFRTMGGETICFVQIHKSLNTPETLCKSTQKYNWWVCIDEIVNEGVSVSYTIDPNIQALFLYNPVLSRIYLYNEEKQRLLPYETPKIVYHGTNRSNIKSIMLTGLRKSTDTPMFGENYYFGLFRKAVRYSCWTSTYETRYDSKGKKIADDNGRYLESGGVMRYALFVGKLKTFVNHPLDRKDTSEQYYNKIKEKPTTKPKENAIIRLHDHTGIWTSMYDTAYAGRTQYNFNGVDLLLMHNPEFVSKDIDMFGYLSHYHIDQSKLPTKWSDVTEKTNLTIE